MLMNAVKHYARDLDKREMVESDTLFEWIESIRSLIQIHIILAGSIITKGSRV